ncbi:hypothetical protein [Methylobacterium gnaphalii]|uniref:Uncharacterized protein n=1 Tax=Methylobacterium gnaphalii TaxID=1010610 RepID=A0A512JPW8_9HYPH|nr:hypothetical protein [Methylobacterium gnaphalii]GEP12010.1 hypothetical protein MGN01_38550 [Methylobacterium gnaphalii]GJD71591.1 hypothetical protein MMMDOFMJ_4554 [Methylobacterium gnaphalii]GLS51222.1 hypothetical protein GCM10007885_40770 [Methylobacterium gnaphalii]
MFNSFADFGLDGLEALRAVIAATPYRTIDQAVASLVVFSHPDTVRQTGCRPFVKTVRDAARRGQIEERGGVLVGLDDNKSPTDAFLWCNALRRPREAQFNHVYADSADPESYTSLANLCVTPSFIAKLTDTDPYVRSLLRYRTFDLYGWVPAGLAEPERPPKYDRLVWAPPLPPVADVEAVSRARMSRKPRDRTVQIVRRIGWVFGDFEATVVPYGKV